MLLTFALVVARLVAADGLAPWRAFLGGAARNATVWAPWTANTASLAGVYARLFGRRAVRAAAPRRPRARERRVQRHRARAPRRRALRPRLRAAKRPPPAAPDASRTLPRRPPPSTTRPSRPHRRRRLRGRRLAHVPRAAQPARLEPRARHVAGPAGGRARATAAARDRRLALIVLALFSVPRQTLARLAGPLPSRPPAASSSACTPSPP